MQRGNQRTVAVKTQRCVTRRTSGLLLLLTTVLAMILHGGFVSTAHAAGITYYVDLNGIDSSGRSGASSQPWRTLGYAVTRAGAGDTIHLNAGTFTESATVNVPPKVSIEGAGRTSTILRGPSGATLLALLSSTPTDGSAVLRDFKIDGQNRTLNVGIEIRGRSNVSVYNIDFVDIFHAGLAQSGTGGDKYIEPSVYDTNLTVRDCTFLNTSTDYATYSSGALMIGGIDGAQIYNNTINSPNQNNGYGIKFTGNGGWFKNTKIHHNTINVNPSDVGNAANPGWGGDFAIELWSVMGGNEIYSNNLNQGISLVNKKIAPTTSIKVYDNKLIYAGPTGTWGKNMGIELMSNDAQVYNNYIERFQFAIVPGPQDGDSTGADRSTITRNVFRDSRYAAIEIDTNTGYTFDSLFVYHNTFDEVNSEGVFTSDLPFVRVRGAGTIATLLLKNNLFLDTHAGTPAYKVKNGDTATLTTADFVANWFGPNVTPIGSTPRTGNPLINGTGARSNWTTFYAPTSGGVIDQGSIIYGQPYNGSAPDNGAVEAAGTTTTPTRTAYTRTEAEAYDVNRGATNYGSNVGSFDNGDWLRYNAVDFGSGANQITIAVATANSGGQILVRLDSAVGPVVGTLNVAPTGSYSTFTEQSATISGATGVHDVYLVGGAIFGVGNLDYLIFSGSGTPTVVAAPTFNPSPGTYTTAQTVALSTATSGASIRYTTDGSTPSSTNGTLYTNPVALNTTTTLKAIAYKSGMTNSTITSGTYTINLPTSTNLALNKAATADSQCGANEGPEKAFNGSVAGGNSDKWCSVGSSKWLRVDLGATYSISQFVVKHAGAGGENAIWNTRDFTIQVSTDGTNWTTPVNVTSNTANTTTHNITAVNARYVRLNIVTPTSNTDTAARIYEFEVFGGAASTNTNLALNKAAMADSQCGASEGPEKAVNGSVSGGNTDKWCSVGSSKWLRVDLGAAYTINQFVVKHAGAGGENAIWNTRDFTIQVSTDGTNWTTPVNVTNNTANITTHTITSVNARYVRLNIVTPTSNTDFAARIYELEVLGS